MPRALAAELVLSHRAQLRVHRGEEVGVLHVRRHGCPEMSGRAPRYTATGVSRFGSRLCAVANTIPGVTRVMQRWSRGQIFFWHGPQKTFTATLRSFSKLISVHSGWVGPKTVTTGTSKAAAMWRGPVSLVTMRSQRRTISLSAPRDMPLLERSRATWRMQRLTDSIIAFSRGAPLI